MTEDRNEALADAVLDAWQAGAEIDFGIATADHSARAELLQLERAALLAAAATGATRASAQPMRQHLYARLLEAGATHAYPDAVEASLRLGALALEMLNVPGEDINSIIRDVRDSNYKPILDEE